ncbi:hypothetical protein V5N11_023515 [Cardamine amara subsp. amara]|uniref:Uncharacterized protein n=1 Tax=Cardamine amara subsp. amara TaxID=228776 RepID=A0ABD1AXN1_CARAN
MKLFDAHFNGTSEKDWDLVKEMGETYPSVVPCFGLHPWFIADRSPHWFNTLNKFFETTPTAAVGEIGLDKSPLASGIDYSDQLVVFRTQLELAKELNKPVAVHCIDAFDDLLEIMRYLGAYFSFSGWFTYIDEKIAKKTFKSIPSDRFLLETDSPDGLPKSDEISSSDPKPTLNEPANILAILDYVAKLSNMKKEELAGLSYENTVRLFSYPGSKLLTDQ